MGDGNVLELIDTDMVHLMISDMKKSIIMTLMFNEVSSLKYFLCNTVLQTLWPLVSQKIASAMHLTSIVQHFHTQTEY